MDYKEAVRVIKNNWPDERYSMLREALTVAIEAMEVDNSRNIRMDVMKTILKLQGTDGNWNYSEYMLGLYNGMEVMVALAEDREPEFKEGPEVWLKDKEVDYGDPVEILDEKVIGNGFSEGLDMVHNQGKYREKFGTGTKK